MTKVALRKVFRVLTISAHPESSYLHEPSRSCERSVFFDIENFFGTWTQGSSSGRSKLTKVALRDVFRFWIVSAHPESS